MQSVSLRASGREVTALRMRPHAPATHSLPARAMPQYGSNQEATACHSALRLHYCLLYIISTCDGHAELLKNLVEEEVDKHPRPPLIYLFFSFSCLTFAHSNVGSLDSELLDGCRAPKLNANAAN